ncbi:MAG: winged helix-turn-helix domain-containing protein, partial [Acidobacteriota bacterium]
SVAKRTRRNDMSRERYRLDDLTLDVGAARLERAGRNVEIAKLSFDLLLALVRHAPDVVAVDTLAREVWPDAVVSDETVVQRVALLRKSLGDDAKNPRYVRAVRGRGYQLVPPVEAVQVLDSAIITKPALLSSPIRTALIFTGLLVVGFIVLFIASWFRAGYGWDDLHPTATTTRPPETEEILNRAEVYLERQRAEDNELAIELLDSILDTSQRDPDVLASLSFALAQRATKFNYSPAEAIRAEALARQAIDWDADHARAYHALGLALDSRGRGTRALEAYRRAHELDPSNLAALASAAYGLQIKGRLAEALQANLTVLAGEADLPYVELQIASTLALLGYEEAARVWFERTLALRPDNVFAAAETAQWHLAHGRLERADEVARDGLSRGIQRPELFNVRAAVALSREDVAAAHTLYKQAEEVTNGGDGRSAVALIALDQSRSRYDRLVTRMRDFRAEGNEWAGSAINEAMLHSAFGAFDEALASLDIAIDLGFRRTGLLRHHPGFEPLWRHPGMTSRLERVDALVARERQRVEAADWLPPNLLAGSEASR